MTPLTELRYNESPIIRGNDYWRDIHKTDCEVEDCGGMVLVTTSLSDPVIPIYALCLRCGQRYVPVNRKIDG